MLTDIAEGLAARGWDVTVLTSRLSYDDPDTSFPPEEIRGGVRVLRVATTRFGRSNLAGRALDYLSFYISSFFRLLRIAGKGDIVIIKTDPPLLSVPLGFACRLRGAKRINWLQDIFPETAAQLGVGLARGPLGSLLAAFRNHSLKKADLNVVIGPRMGERIKEFGVEPSRITEIQNFCDDEAIRPIARESNPLRVAWGYTDNDFIVGYSGNLGRAHDLGTFLGAAEILKDQPEIKFLFIGGGHLRRQLEEKATKRNLTSIHTRPYQPREQLALSLSVPDVHWVSLVPSLEGLILPSKLYGIAAAGRPLIMVGDPDGDIARWAVEYRFGYAVRIGDAEAFAMAIRELKEDQAALRLLGQNARRFLDFGPTRAKAADLWTQALLGQAT
jgi:glycosyltransferase involved in cell wall biosynthesis